MNLFSIQSAENLSDFNGKTVYQIDKNLIIYLESIKLKVIKNVSSSTTHKKTPSFRLSVFTSFRTRI